MLPSQRADVRSEPNRLSTARHPPTKTDADNGHTGDARGEAKRMGMTSTDITHRDGLRLVREAVAPGRPLSGREI